MSPTALRCVGLTKAFGATRAVDKLDLTVEEGQVLSLLGPSGCGKTTTLRLVAGFERPDEGEVWIQDRLVASAAHYEPPEQRNIGMVFQDYALFPHLTVAQNIAYGLREESRKQQIKRQGEILELVRLNGMEERYPHQLSGGEQQRVALARALAPEPVAILLDEPFSNMDAAFRAEVRQEVRDILKANSVTAIFVTHDQEEALFMGDLVAVQYQGHLEQVDTPEAIFHAPASSFVARFMGMADFLPARLEGGTLWTEIGPVPNPRAVAPGDGLEVMVRPDDLSITPSERGPDRITKRIFQGAFYLYQVALPSGVILHSLRPHTEEYPVGTSVEARLVEHPLLCFRDGYAILGEGSNPQLSP